MTRPLDLRDATESAVGPSTSFSAALTVTSLSTFVTMLAYSGLLGNASTVGAALSATSAGAMWMLGAMSVGLAVSLLTAGTVADRSGRRRVFELGAGVFAIGSIVCATAGTPVQFIVGRIVEGIGAAGLIATGLGIVVALSGDTRARSIAAGWWGASMGLGIALGPVLTGLFDLADRWRAFYWLLAATGVIIAAAARRSLRETAVISGARPNLIGAAALTTTVALLLIALTDVRQGAIGSAWLCTGGVIVAAVVFAFSQLRARSPLIDYALFRRGDFVAATIAAAMTGAGVIALMSFICTFLVVDMRMSTLHAGAMIALWSGTSALFALVSRRLSARMTGTVQLAVGLAATGVGLLLLTGLTVASTGARLVPGLLVAGIATGVLNAGLGRQATATLPVDRAAVGVGMNNTARYIGAAIGVTLIGVIAAAPHHNSAAQVSGWNHVAVLAGALSLVGAVAVPAAHRWIG